MNEMKTMRKQGPQKKMLFQSKASLQEINILLKTNAH